MYRWLIMVLLVVFIPACSSPEAPDKQPPAEDDKKGASLTPGEQVAKQKSIPAMPVIPADVARNLKQAEDKSADKKADETESKTADKTAEETQEKVADDSKQGEQWSEELSEEEIAEKSLVDRHMAVLKEYNDAMREFRTAYTKAKPEERQKLFAELYPQADSYADRLLELVKEDPQYPKAFEALSWVMRQARTKSPAAQELIVEHFIDSEELANVALGKMYDTPSQATEDFLQKVIDESPHDRVKAIAAYVQASFLNRGLSTLARITDEERKQDLVSAAGTEFKSLVETGETTDGRTIEEMLENVAEKYGDVVLSKRGDNVTKIGPRIESALFEMRYLAIGKVAPDIEGEDIDGTEFKLSDYRGKVVVLDFWGDW